MSDPIKYNSSNKYYVSEILLHDGWQQDKTLTVKNGEITQISDGKESDAERIRGPVIPGMVNLHSHAFQKAFVGLTEFQANKDDSFWSWRDSMYRLLQCLTPEDMNTIAKYVYQEMLLQGYTSCAEFHYLHHQSNGKAYDDPAINSKMVIDAAQSVGIALCHCPVFYHYSGFGEQLATDGQRPFLHSVSQFQKLLEQLQQYVSPDSSNKSSNNKNSNNTDSQIKSSLITLGIAPHSLRAVSKAQMDELVTWWQGKGPVHIHIAEQLKEVNDSLEFYGQRPVEWLLNNQPVDHHWCLVHATHLTSDETSAMARSRAIAGICPQTEANLGDGIFNADEYFQHKGQFGIGSDSHIAISPWQELRMFEYSQRLKHHRRNFLCNDDLPHVGRFLWQSAAKQGANVINRNTGELAVGKKADWVVLDQSIAELNSVSGDFLLDAAIFAANENPVKDVMVNGQWRVQNRQLISPDNNKQNYLAFLKQKVNRP